MAKLKLYSAFDSKLKVWMSPMSVMHAGQAERMWMELANDGQSMVSKHPADFTLFQVGEFDDESGVVLPLRAPVQLLSGVAAKEKPLSPLPLSPNR